MNMFYSFIKLLFTKEYSITAGSIPRSNSSSMAVDWGSGIIDTDSKIYLAKKYFN